MINTAPIYLTGRIWWGFCLMLMGWEGIFIHFERQWMINIHFGLTQVNPI
ncbi:hypothetical protein NC651_023554 [Populus alba x Populus x berolinensis]|nr:hypothetical protein NC651_023554 [Populus alba x Populus x berolinensis]